jgi:hypothetical protein
MSRKYAGFLLLCVCLILAVLLLTETITFVASGCIFAIALISFGVLSKGFRENK